MNKVEIAVDIAADAGRAWETLADFGAFLDWAGGGQGEIRIEGEGIGMTRHLELPGAVKLAERLTRRDVESRTLAYQQFSFWRSLLCKSQKANIRRRDGPRPARSTP